MLLGRLKTATGLTYTPTHSAKGGRRYFYYTLKSREINETESTLKRLPATEVENLVFDALRRFFEDSAGLADHFGLLGIQQMRLLSSAASVRAAILRDGSVNERISLVRRIVSDVVVVTGTKRICLQRYALHRELLGGTCDQPDQGLIALEERFHMARRGSEARLILSHGKSSRGEPVPSLKGAIFTRATGEVSEPTYGTFV